MSEKIRHTVKSAQCSLATIFSIYITLFIINYLITLNDVLSSSFQTKISDNLLNDDIIYRKYYISYFIALGLYMIETAEVWANEVAEFSYSQNNLYKLLSKIHYDYFTLWFSRLCGLSLTNNCGYKNCTKICVPFKLITIVLFTILYYSLY